VALDGLQGGEGLSPVGGLRKHHPDIQQEPFLQLAEVVKDAQKATQSLQLSLANATLKYSYYQKPLGRTDAQDQALERKNRQGATRGADCQFRCARSARKSE
jgi:hypothetical protein